uniref:NADH-ubiquinone oxidoreductase chain 5 n=1 Tax=Longipodacrangonyx sp. 1 MDMBR-2012 TaxID=1200665 RepID=K7ZVY6_9CRUS|nr:NADH dehydrogenase subunit 5 [Longipodacrangonyx sp. 1 MDMBR-2012]
MKLKKSIYYIYMVLMLLLSIISLVLSMILITNNYTIFLEWELFFFNGASIIFLMVFDAMSSTFVFTVSLISATICGYSKYYMEGDKYYQRFMMILLLFVASMILLILSPNLISLLLGWDGLGLSSYILVIYYQNEYACNSGMLTILSNRIGDSMILMSICLMYMNHSWNFLLENNTSKLLLMLMITSAITKSAQIPFSAWLPAAMAAPTPVSALVHSSTLVTAGVYLLIRFYPCFYDKHTYMYLMIVSSLTMVMSGWMANFEMDMKKIIALSTLSQLGLMMMIISLGMPELSFFHLITHAMFKSTIFMCAGIMIHNMMGSQDLRMSGNFFISGPFLGLFFSITNMSLCGFPFLAGFFSKDLILENILANNINIFFHFMSMLGTGLTITYSLRIMFFMSEKTVKSASMLLEEINPFLSKTMIIMLIMSVVSGFFLSWNFIPQNLLFLNLTDIMKFYIMIIMITFLVVTMMMLKNQKLNYSLKMYLLKKASHLMMYLPYITTQISSHNALKESAKFNKIIDSGWLEYCYGMFLYNKMSNANYKMIFMQISKFLKTMLITMLITIIILMNIM